MRLRQRMTGGVHREISRRATRIARIVDRLSPGSEYVIHISKPITQDAPWDIKIYRESARKSLMDVDNKTTPLEGGDVE